MVYLPGTPDQPHPRSNDYSAVSAEYNFAEFFERLSAYGLDSHQYFLHAKLPLKIFYRSGIRPGPGKNGNTINARVMVDGQSEDYEGGGPDVIRPFLQVHLALASLSTRFREPRDRKHRSQAQPMGIATDRRWIWHESRHVLIMARPASCSSVLPTVPATRLPQLSEIRNPFWQRTGSGVGPHSLGSISHGRHDRCVCDGWSWTGLLHRDLSQVELIQGPRRKGYWSEQILSSSLFRLYRCIGGDTTESQSSDINKAARESASHYCVYLIMRGIQLLGTTFVVPAYEPDQFVSALIDADIGTGPWDVAFQVPPDAPDPNAYFQFHRVGGCVHKVIRWAFEAQGLYGAFSTPRDARGMPPPVDIFIKDLRPLSDAATFGPVEYGPGSYVPVSLDWSSDQDAPAWQADPQEGIITSEDGIYVNVGNRGSETAQYVTVSVWWCPWPADTPPPQWNDPNWQPFDPAVAAEQDIEARLSSQFWPIFSIGPSSRVALRRPSSSHLR